MPLSPAPSVLQLSLLPAADSGDTSLRPFFLKEMGHLALPERGEGRPKKGPPGGSTILA